MWILKFQGIGGYPTFLIPALLLPGEGNVTDRIALFAIQKWLQMKWKMNINDKNHYFLLWYLFCSMPIRWAVLIFILYNFSFWSITYSSSETLRNVFFDWLHVKFCEVQTNFICNPKSTEICYLMITCKVL